MFICWKQFHSHSQPCSNFLSDRGIGFLALEKGQISENHKTLKTIPLLLEIMQCPITKPKEMP